MGRPKRNAQEQPEGDDARPAKTAKGQGEDGAKPPAKKPGRKPAPKAPYTADEFTEKARPLYLSITHTAPPSAEGEEGAGAASGSSNPNNPNDVGGVLDTITLNPSTFSTGSYGWKGNKKLTIEMPGTDGVKVEISITANATVSGSKPSKKPAGKKAKDEDEDAGGEDDE